MLRHSYTTWGQCCLRSSTSAINNETFLGFFSSIFSQSQATKKISTNNSDQNHVFFIYLLQFSSLYSPFRQLFTCKVYFGEFKMLRTRTCQHKGITLPPVISKLRWC